MVYLLDRMIPSGKSITDLGQPDKVFLFLSNRFRDTLNYIGINNLNVGLEIQDAIIRCSYIKGITLHGITFLPSQVSREAALNIGNMAVHFATELPNLVVLQMGRNAVSGAQLYTIVIQYPRINSINIGLMTVSMTRVCAFWHDMHSIWYALNSHHTGAFEAKKSWSKGTWCQVRVSATWSDRCRTIFYRTNTSHSYQTWSCEPEQGFIYCKNDGIWVLFWFRE